MNFKNVQRISIPQGSVTNLSINDVQIWQISKLPVGYTQIEYIEGTGTQYIDTRIPTDTICKSEYDLQLTAITENPFGYWYPSDSPSRVRWSCGWSMNVSNYLYPNPSATGYEWKDSNIPIDFERHLFTMDFISNCYKIDSNRFSINNYFFGTSKFNFTFFTRNSLTGIGTCVKSKFYSVKFYDTDNNLIRDFIPCINSLNEVGMYDLISNMFFGNNGTGEFIAGDPV